jgi:hypothetical protein
LHQEAAAAHQLRWTIYSGCWQATAVFDAHAPSQLIALGAGRECATHNGTLHQPQPHPIGHPALYRKQTTNSIVTD